MPASAESRRAIVRDVTGDLPSPELDIHNAVFGYDSGEADRPSRSFEVKVT